MLFYVPHARHICAGGSKQALTDHSYAVREGQGMQLVFLT